MNIDNLVDENQESSQEKINLPPKEVFWKVEKHQKGGREKINLSPGEVWKVDNASTSGKLNSLNNSHRGAIPKTTNQKFGDGTNIRVILFTF